MSMNDQQRQARIAELVALIPTPSERRENMHGVLKLMYLIDAALITSKGMEITATCVGMEVTQGILKDTLTHEEVVSLLGVLADVVLADEERKLNAAK
jgi:hypothetical protein